MCVYLFVCLRIEECRSSVCRVDESIAFPWGAALCISRTRLVIAVVRAVFVKCN